MTIRYGYRAGLHRAFSLSLLLALASVAALRPVSADEAPAVGPPRVALVLQGGGALGVAHIGVLKVMEELGIPVDIVVGTSMGAIVGGLYSIGYTAADLEAEILGTDWLSLFLSDELRGDERIWERMDRTRYALGMGLARGELLFEKPILSDRRILMRFDRFTSIGAAPDDFDDFPRRYRAVATDIASSERVVISSGSLSDAMRASMSLPGIFSPYRLDGRALVDGGLVSNLPVDVAEAMGADVIIAVHLTSETSIPDDVGDITSVATVMKSLDILMGENVKDQLSLASCVIDVDLSGYYIPDFHKSEEILAIGERAARDQIAALRGVKDRLAAAGRGDSSSVDGLTASPITGVRVEGAEGKERAGLLAEMGGLVGTTPGDEAVGELLAGLEARNVYSSIRLKRRRGADGDSLTLSVGRAPPVANKFMLGFLSEDSYTRSITSDSSFYAGASIRGFPTDGSWIRAGVSGNDRPSIELSLIQAIGPGLYAELSYAAAAGPDTFETALSDTRTAYRGQGTAALRLGYSPLSWFDVSAGARFDSLSLEAASYPDVLFGPDVGTEAALSLALRVLTIDNFIFPRGGLVLDTRYLQGLPFPGGSRPFMTLEAHGRLVPRIDIPFSVELEWMLGTDFSVSGDDADAAPAPFKPMLRNHRMFPALMRDDERMGGYVGGLSLLAKHQLNWSSRAIGIPVYALLHGSAGAALQKIDHFQALGDYTSYVVDGGLGLRLNEAFGLMLRAGASIGFNREPRVFFALDIGAFGQD